MPSTHNAYQQWRPEYFEERARQIGESTLSYIGRLIEQGSYPEVAYKQAAGVLSFVKTYSAERLENACKRALDYHKASYYTVQNILKNRLDMQEQLEPEQGIAIGDHHNLRDAAQYQ
jgi:hypothetical protein